MLFGHNLVNLRRTEKGPTVLSSLQSRLTIAITLREIYFLTNFCIFCKGLHHLFLRKMKKIKKFQVWISIDWKLNNELNEIWHFSFWLLFLFWQPKNWVFIGKNRVKIFVKYDDSDFCQKCEIFFWFFNRSLAKSRRTAKRLTVLSSLLDMLTITITLRKIYFLANFRIFCNIIYFCKKFQKN